MIIHIEDLKFQCIIGILDFERVTPQDIIINLTSEYEYKDEYINYAHIVEMVKNIMIKNQFELIEDALNYIAKELQREYSLIDRVDIKITKPAILAECVVSVGNHYEFKS